MLVLIGAMQHFKTGRVIFETSGLGALFLEDQQWIAEYWYELAINAGYEKVAFIIPGKKENTNRLLWYGTRSIRLDKRRFHSR
jgi:hypothetical protein